MDDINGVIVKFETGEEYTILYSSMKNQDVLTYNVFYHFKESCGIDPPYIYNETQLTVPQFLIIYDDLQGTLDYEERVFTDVDNILYILEYTGYQMRIDLCDVSFEKSIITSEKDYNEILKYNDPSIVPFKLQYFIIDSNIFINMLKIGDRFIVNTDVTCDENDDIFGMGIVYDNSFNRWHTCDICDESIWKEDGSKENENPSIVQRDTSINSSTDFHYDCFMNAYITNMRLNIKYATDTGCDINLERRIRLNDFIKDVISKRGDENLNEDSVKDPNNEIRFYTKIDKLHSTYFNEYIQDYNYSNTSWYMSGPISFNSNIVNGDEFETDHETSIYTIGNDTTLNDISYYMTLIRDVSLNDIENVDLATFTCRTSDLTVTEIEKFRLFKQWYVFYSKDLVGRVMDRFNIYNDEIDCKFIKSESLSSDDMSDRPIANGNDNSIDHVHHEIVETIPDNVYSYVKLNDINQAYGNVLGYDITSFDYMRFILEMINGKKCTHVTSKNFDENDTYDKCETFGIVNLNQYHIDSPEGN